VLYLVAAVARHVTFSDPGRFAAALFDEAWYLTSSLQGRALLLDGIRDGRKHNAAIWLVSQHSDDLGDDALAHLLGPRFVFRQARAAAPAALHSLGSRLRSGPSTPLPWPPRGRACSVTCGTGWVGSTSFRP